MKKYIFVDDNGNKYGEEIQAKNKIQACKSMSIVYFKGNKPYAVTSDYKLIHPIIVKN